MAVAAMRVPTIFTAVDRFSGVVSKMTGGVSAFGRTAEAAAMRTSRRMNSLGTSTLYAGAGMAIGLGYAIDQAGKFEKAISNISTLTESTPAQMEAYGDSILAMAKKVPVAISDLTDAGYDVVSAGIVGASNQLNVLNKSAILAVAGLGTTKEAVDITTSALNAFQIEGSKAGEVTNKLMKAVKYGKTTVAGISESFGNFASIMKNSGVTLDEYLASTAALTTTGMSMSRAQTQVSSATLALMKPNKKMEAVFAQLNVKDVPTFIKQSGGLIGALNKIGDMSDKMGFKIAKVLGRKEGLSAFLSLTGAQKDKFNEIMNDMLSGSNVVDEAFAKQSKTFSSGMQRMQNSASILAIKIGTILIPKVNELISQVTPLIDSLTEWIKRNKSLVNSFLKLTLLLLGLGLALKIGAFYFYAFSKAIAFATFITSSYNAIMITAALSGQGLTYVLTGLAASIYATLWPLLIVGSALYVIVDMVNNWKDWNNVVLLCLGPLGLMALIIQKIIKHWENITSLFKGEGILGAIKGIGALLEDVVLGTLVGIFNIMGRLPLIGGPFKEMAADLSNIMSKIPSDLSIGTVSNVNSLNTFGGTMPTFGEKKPIENLAGKKENTEAMLTKVFGKQVVEVLLSDPGGYAKDVKVNGVSASGGIPVKSSSTTGQRGN